MPERAAAAESARALSRAAAGQSGAVTRISRWFGIEVVVSQLAPVQRGVLSECIFWQGRPVGDFIQYAF